MQKTYREGFKLTNDGDGLRIEAVDYHSKPLYLDEAALAEIGLHTPFNCNLGGVYQSVGSPIRGSGTTSISCFPLG